MIAQVDESQAFREFLLMDDCPKQLRSVCHQQNRRSIGEVDRDASLVEVLGCDNSPRGMGVLDVLVIGNDAVLFQQNRLPFVQTCR